MTPRARPAIICALIALAPAASACDEINRPKSWRLTYPRVLAQRSEVVGDESRATPEPGERVRLRVLIAGADPVERVSYRMAICAALPTNGGVPACAGAPFATLEGVLGEEKPFAGELAVELDVPARGELGGVKQALVIGTACTDGDARLPSGTAPTGVCMRGDEPPLSWVGHVALAYDASEHDANPELAADAISFDDDVWPTAVPPDPIDAGAPGAGAGDAGEVDEDAGEPDAGEVTARPLIAVEPGGEPHEIEVNLRDAGRERFEGEREALVLSAFTTAGALQRRFSVLERDQPDDDALSFEWHSPRPAPGKGLPDRARIVFVLRDQRGGVAFTERVLRISDD